MKKQDIATMEEILNQLMDFPTIYRVFTILLVVQDFATIHSMSNGKKTLKAYSICVRRIKEIFQT